VSVVRRVIVIQARMTSTRLPGKVLADLSGRPMLERQLERLAGCARADDVVLATTGNRDDDPVVALADRLGLRWFRGSEHDVLGRYAGAAADARADLVVRVTADCPLLDPHEVDVVIAALETRPDAADYAANVLAPGLPRGQDCEALWRDTLLRMDRLATSAPAREHVTWFCRAERPELFLRHAVRRPFEAGDLRWTVDTADDLAMVRRLYAELDLAHRSLPLADVIGYVRAHPDIAAMNAHVAQKDPSA
jgi:spore coat polysaccharide biosynthesis protein SpsF